MAAIDTLRDRGHDLPRHLRFDATDLNLYATVINAGAPLRATTKRLILRQARQLLETPPCK